MTTRNISISALATTTEADLYTVAPNFNADIEMITCSNNNGAGQHVTIKWVDATTSTTYILLDDVQVPADSFFQLEKPLLLNSGDKIRISSNASIHIHVAVRAKETYTPSLRT